MPCELETRQISPSMMELHQSNHDIGNNLPRRIVCHAENPMKTIANQTSRQFRLAGGVSVVLLNIGRQTSSLYNSSSNIIGMMAQQKCNAGYDLKENRL